VAKADNQPIENEEIVKGFEHTPGQWVVFDKDELESLKPESSRTVEIQQFVPLEQIDPIYFDRSYYVVPDQNGAKAYGLLAKAMEARGTVAVCTITLRDKEHLATLRLSEGVFVLATMLWPDEVRPVDHEQLGTADLPEPRRQEVQMAEQLISQLTENFDPSQYADSYRQRLLEAADAKVAGEEVTVPEEEPEAAPVVDLMDALRRSMHEHGGEAAEEAAEAGAPDQAESEETPEEATAEAASGGSGAQGGGKKATARKAAKKKAQNKAAEKQPQKSAKKTAKKSAQKKSAQKKQTGKKTSSGRQRKAS
jgi:DNA end-binding protein Ku